MHIALTGIAEANRNQLKRTGEIKITYYQNQRGGHRRYSKEQHLYHHIYAKMAQPVKG